MTSKISTLDRGVLVARSDDRCRTLHAVFSQGRFHTLIDAPVTQGRNVKRVKLGAGTEWSSGATNERHWPCIIPHPNAMLIIRPSRFRGNAVASRLSNNLFKADHGFHRFHPWLSNATAPQLTLLQWLCLVGLPNFWFTFSRFRL